MYYPHVSGGARTATLCDTTDGKDDCSKLTSGKVAVCNHGTDAGGHDINPLTRCTVTVLDHFTSSFHWSQTNFSAIWLRPQWYLVDNLVLTDVQDGGISFITSGDYARASVIDGDWAVMRTSILIGHTQAQATKKGDTTVNPSAQDSGPLHKSRRQVAQLRERNPADPILHVQRQRGQLSARQFRHGPAVVQHL